MKTIQTTNAPAAIGPYAQGKVVNGLLFASGQVPLDPKSGEVIGEDITAQTKQVLQNIHGILEAARVGFDAVVKTTCFLKDMNDFNAFNEVYTTAFQEPYPARSAVEVARLPKDVLVEIEVIAVVQ